MRVDMQDQFKPKKRLKKNCPCDKCLHWRNQRDLRRLQAAFASAYTPAPGSLVGGGPLICEPITFTLSKKHLTPAPSVPVMIGQAAPKPVDDKF